ncbi:MAG: hypothetical protein AABY32_02450 [Nanoarchaeota archaeon]
MKKLDDTVYIRPDDYLKKVIKTKKPKFLYDKIPEGVRELIIKDTPVATSFKKLDDGTIVDNNTGQKYLRKKTKAQKDKEKADRKDEYERSQKRAAVDDDFSMTAHFYGD